MARGMIESTCPECGKRHWVSRQFGSRAAATRWEAYAEANPYQCPECYAAAKRAEAQARRKQEAAEAADRLARLGIALPALEGTERQIAWAADIRAKAVAEMFDSPSAARNALAKAIKATPTSPAEALASALKGQDLSQAKWWIDHRDELCGSILAERLAANLAADAK